jgi:adenylate kinase family enzyme
MIIKKIAILGLPGAGKTTLANKLGPLLKIRVIYLDHIFWKRGWQAVPREERIDCLEELVRERKWIIDGAYLDISETRLEAADIVIYLDIHPLICLWRIIKRHCESHGRFRRDIPLECTDKLTPFRVWSLLVYPFRDQGEFEKKLLKFPPEKIIRLDSAKKVKAFLADPEQWFHEKRQPVEELSTLKQGVQNSTKAVVRSPSSNYWTKISLPSAVVQKKVGKLSI